MSLGGRDEGAGDGERVVSADVAHRVDVLRGNGTLCDGASACVVGSNHRLAVCGDKPLRADRDGVSKIAVR
jgi:hypothetical protein